MQVLSHLRVIEISSSAATSYCARLFADSEPMCKRSSHQSATHFATVQH